jgi:hypothetical protein
VTVVTVIAAAGGCAYPVADALGRNGSGLTSALSFRYTATSGTDDMDQLLEIDNGSGESLVPTLRFTPLDQNEQPVPGVTVTTVYGSDQGRLVVGPEGYADALVFHGAKADEVADVRVDVARLTVAKQAVGPVEELQPTLEDAAGNPVDDPAQPFAEVSLSNVNDTPLTVRVVYIVWQESPTGESQQAREVISVGGLITVPASGNATVPVAGDAAAAVAEYAGSTSTNTSLKVFPSQ